MFGKTICYNKNARCSLVNVGLETGDVLASKKVLVYQLGLFVPYPVFEKK